MQTAAENQPVIELRNLEKRFQTPKGDVIALQDINMQVFAGDIYGIIGMSGAGKTTLVRCMNFLERPTDGQVIVDGCDLGTLKPKELQRVRMRESMIFQHFNLLMQETVARNIRFALDVAGRKGREADQRVNELLKIVGLPDKAHAYPVQLSGGQKQRVAIARALANDPKILLCDEATSALDPMTTRSILELLKEINQQLGVTVIIITHEMSVIREVCTKVAVIDGSRVVEEGVVEEVFAHPKSAAAKRLFYSSEYAANGPGKRYRLVFNEKQTDQPILAGAMNACSAPINIIYANIQQIGGKGLGQMIVELPKDERCEQLALDYFRMQNVWAEEVAGHVVQ